MWSKDTQWELWRVVETKLFDCAGRGIAEMATMRAAMRRNLI